MRKILFDNLALKLIALVLATILFLIVKSEGGSLTTLDVPLKIQVPEGFVLVNEPTEAAAVRLKGNWSTLKDLGVEELGVLELSPSPVEGRSDLTLKLQGLTLPSGIIAVGIDPPTVTIELERLARRTVPVAADRALSGAPPVGYQLGEVRSEPSEIDIVGPTSVVEMVNRVFVEPIDLSGRTSSFKAERFVLPDRRAIQIEGNDRVSVSVEIITRSRELVVKGIPIIVLDLAQPFELLPETVDVVLVGEDEALDSVDSSLLVVTIDGASESGKPPHSAQIEITTGDVHNLPPGVAVDGSRLPTIFLRTTPIPTRPEPPVNLEDVPTNGTGGQPDGVAPGVKQPSTTVPLTKSGTPETGLD